MTDTMRERMAMALWPYIHIDGMDCPHRVRWSDKSQATKPTDAEKARAYAAVDAVLAALETPNKAMMIAGNSPCGYTMDGYPQPHTSTDVWAAMVKAIRVGA